jgi:hypothetical protein
MGASRSSTISIHFDPYTGHCIFIFIYLFTAHSKWFQSLILQSAAMVGLIMNNELNPNGNGCRKIRGTIPGSQDSPPSIHPFFFYSFPSFAFPLFPILGFSLVIRHSLYLTKLWQPLFFRNSEHFFFFSHVCSNAIISKIPLPQLTMYYFQQTPK